VVLTMLASLSFDPRLSWDSRQQQQAENEREREQPLLDNREEKPA
jgi:paraquat-inducible protein A